MGVHAPHGELSTSQSLQAEYNDLVNAQRTAQPWEYDGLHDPTAIGFLPHTNWGEPKVLKGLGLLCKGVDEATAEAIYNASLVGDEEALAAALAQLPELAAEDGWHIIDRYGCEPLGQACSHGHLEAVNLLLEKGAAVNAVAETCGRTALHRAASGGHAPCVARLIEATVDCNAQARDGSVALHAAAAGGHEETVIALLEAEEGTDVDRADAIGQTPLMAAAEAGHTDIVRLLCERGFPVSATDRNGWTALHYASAGGSMETASALIELGARTSLTIGGVPPTRLNAAIAKELEEALAAAAAEDAAAEAQAPAPDGEGDQPPLV